jgi:hypothetical protein
VARDWGGWGPGCTAGRSEEALNIEGGVYSNSVLSRVGEIPIGEFKILHLVAVVNLF